MGHRRNSISFVAANAFAFDVSSRRIFRRRIRMSDFVRSQAAETVALRQVKPAAPYSASSARLDFRRRCFGSSAA